MLPNISIGHNLKLYWFEYDLAKRKVKDTLGFQTELVVWECGGGVGVWE